MYFPCSCCLGEKISIKNMSLDIYGAFLCRWCWANFFFCRHACNKKGNKAVKGYWNINNKRANMSAIEMLTCVLTQTMIRYVCTVRKFYTGLYRSYLNDTLSLLMPRVPAVHTKLRFHLCMSAELLTASSILNKNAKFHTYPVLCLKIRDGSFWR